MPRIIKFRAWDKVAEDMVWFDLPSIARGLYLFEPTNDRAFELMQYTGLKDKNGKEIYEADRLKQGAFTRTVRYNIGKGAWYAGELRLTQTLASRMEIRDNIYENKNLGGDYV